MTAQAGDTLSKSSLRSTLRSRRARLEPAQRHAAAIRAASQAASFLAQRGAYRIAVYLACGSELDTQPLLDWLWARQCEVYAPRIRAGFSMEFLRLRPETALRANQHGIAEPSGRCIRTGLRRLDAIVMPLVGFDARGNRLGAGAGYYDRALAGLRQGRAPLRVGYAYAMQQVESLPSEAWDIRLDAVITENGVMRWPTG